MLQYFLEIRNRFFLVATSWISTLYVSYLYKEMLLFLMVYSNKFTRSVLFYFVFTNALEVLKAYFEIISLISFQILTLFFVFHTFVFLSPALFKAEFLYFKRWVKLVLALWVLGFLVSICFIIPSTWNFFLSFQNLMLTPFFNLQFEAKLKDYVDFYTSFHYSFMFYFQFFIIFLLALDYIKVYLKVVKKFRKFYHYSFVIISTLISPPDLTSQIFISVFLIVLYESLIFIFIFKHHFAGQKVNNY